MQPYYKNLLIVDDDLDILEAIQALLTLEGFTVRGISDGARIFEMFEELMPDLLIMDINIGGMDGRDICRDLKQHTAYHQLPIILFSASQLSVSEVLTCGANDFLPKPFDIKHLLEKILVHLRISQRAM